MAANINMRGGQQKLVFGNSYFSLKLRAIKSV